MNLKPVRLSDHGKREAAGLPLLARSLRGRAGEGAERCALISSLACFRASLKLFYSGNTNSFSTGMVVFRKTLHKYGMFPYRYFQHVNFEKNISAKYAKLTSGNNLGFPANPAQNSVKQVPMRRLSAPLRSAAERGLKEVSRDAVSSANRFKP